MVVNNPNMVAPKAQPASARPAVETGVSAPRVAAPVRTAPVVQEPAPVYHPTRLVAETATADKTATATATPATPHVSAQQGGQSGTSNASQSAHVQVTPRGVYRQTTTTQNGQTTQSNSFMPAQNASQGAAQGTNSNIGRTNPYVNSQLPQDAQNSEKNTTIQVDHSKLDNDIAQAKKDGVQVTHTADDQPIVVHSQNEAHDYEDQASQEYNNEDQAIIKADNIQKAYNADKSAADAANQQIQQAGKDAASQGVTVDTSKTQTIDFSGHTPSLQDAQTMHGQIQSLTQNELNQIKQAEAKYKQEVDQAWQSMGQSISGNARADGKLIDSGIKSTQGVSAADSPVYLHNGNSAHLVYCVQPYGVGPGVDGTSDHVTLQTGIQGNGDQQRTLAGIMYLGFGGPGNQGYSQLETHLALSYYLYHNDLAHIKNWEQTHEGVTDQIADQWLHYGKVQQLINAAENWDKDGSIMYRLYSGHADNTTNGNSQDADSDKNVSGSRGSQLLVAANFTKRPPHIPLQVKLIGVKTPTVKADYHYMSAKLGNTDTQTNGSAMPNININVSANANAKAKAKANANANVNVNANAKGQGNANANGSAKGCGMSRGHGGAGGRGCGAGAATGTGAGCGMGSGYGNCGMVESVPACGGYGAVDTGAGYGAGVVSPLVATGAVSGQGAVSMPVAAAGNGVGAGNGAGEGVAMPATGQKNGSVLTDLAAVAAAIVGGSMLLKKRNA